MLLNRLRNIVSLGQMAADKALDTAVTIVVSEEDEHRDGGSTVPESRSGMQITFRNLVYQVTNKQNKKEQTEILHGLSGFFNPSQMTAVMGPRFVQASSCSLHAELHYVRPGVCQLSIGSWLFLLSSYPCCAIYHELRQHFCSCLCSVNRRCHCILTKYALSYTVALASLPCWTSWPSAKLWARSRERC